jgi:transcriptional regulator with XRE-family HTH domain
MQDWYQLTDFEILAEIGNRMKALRISKNFTQQALAEHSGLNRSTIRDLENGKPLNMLSIIQVFRSLDMLSKINELLPGAENSPIMASQQLKRKRVKLSKKGIIGK